MYEARFKEDSTGSLTHWMPVNGSFVKYIFRCYFINPQEQMQKLNAGETIYTDYGEYRIKEEK